MQISTCQNCVFLHSNLNCGTYISKDNEFAGGRFIVSTATPESSCTLLTTKGSCDENARSDCSALRALHRCNDGRRRRESEGTISLAVFMIYDERVGGGRRDASSDDDG